MVRPCLKVKHRSPTLLAPLNRYWLLIFGRAAGRTKTRAAGGTAAERNQSAIDPTAQLFVRKLSTPVGIPIAKPFCEASHKFGMIDFAIFIGVERLDNPAGKERTRPEALGAAQ